MEECDDTASPNDNSAPENSDSEGEPNYNLRVDSYLDSSNSNSSSLHEVNICVLNGKKCKIENKEIKQNKANKTKRKDPLIHKGKKTNCYVIHETHRKFKNLQM